MIDLKLHRFCYGPLGTFGSMSVEGSTLYTVERPWLNNEPNVSCIPEGEYPCRPRRFNRGGYDAIEITNVPGRSLILFHVANVRSNVKGCIGVGYELGCLGADWAVLESKSAFAHLMKHFGERDFTLEISSPEV